MDKYSLTPSQVRSLQVSLHQFEMSLRMVDQLLSDGDSVGILYTRKSSLNIKSREQMKKKIAITLKELEDFVKKLNLRPAEENMENIISAEMSISWESLLECRSTRMRGYGELDPEAVKIIDPAVSHFADIALGLCNLSANDLKETSQ